jgi:hypothetical protein
MFASLIPALRSISRSILQIFSRTARGQIKLLWQTVFAVTLGAGSVPTFAELCPSSVPPTQKWESFNANVVGYGDTPLEGCRRYYGAPKACSNSPSEYCGGTDYVIPVANGLGAQHWCVNWTIYNNSSYTSGEHTKGNYISQRVNVCPSGYRLPSGVFYWDVYNVRKGVPAYCVSTSCKTGFFVALSDEPIDDAKSCSAPKPNPFIFNPVSVASGNKRLLQSDIIPIQSLSLGFTRYYNSYGGSEGHLGSHWTHSYSSSVELTSEPPITYPAKPTLLQSGNYGSPSDACSSGWVQIQPNTELAGKPTTVTLTADGRCSISSEGKVWRTLTIYSNDGVVYRTLGTSAPPDVLKVHRADGRIVVF